MPRPNRARGVFAEDNLAARIAVEREQRGWTYEGLAKRMSDAGCPLDQSAVYKIEKSKPRRRIVVDELVAFAQVFGVSVEDLLLPPEIATRREVVELLIHWNVADQQLDAAKVKCDEAWQAVKDYATAHPDVAPVLEDLLGRWADHYIVDDYRTVEVAKMMRELTRDARWADIIRADLDRLTAQDDGSA